MFERYGRHGIDYPEHEYPALHAETPVELDRQSLDLIGERRSVILDYGFWTREGRERYKTMIEQAGGHWRLSYFPAGLDVVRVRVKERNRRSDANALPIDEHMLEEFLSRWQPPRDEGEEVVE